MEVVRFLIQILSVDQTIISSAMQEFDCPSQLPDFPYALLALIAGSFSFQSSPFSQFRFLIIAFVEYRAHNHGLRLATATCLKNFVKNHLHLSDPSSPKFHQLRNKLVLVVLQAQHLILKILVETVSVILQRHRLLFVSFFLSWLSAFYLRLMFVVVKHFVKDNLWPKLVPELKSVVMSSDIVGMTMHSQWNTINALLLLQST